MLGGRFHAHNGSEVGITFGNADPGGGGRSTLTVEVKLGLPLAMLICWGGQIRTYFGSEVGITFGNADPRGGGRSALTLEVKLGLPLAMLILGGGADLHSLWK